MGLKQSKLSQSEAKDLQRTLAVDLKSVFAMIQDDVIKEMAESKTYEELESRLNDILS